ncbi:hypothetical protein M3215_08685 [Bacillus cytotoxicus]|uniref:Uncharacterized protein n=1 Tax=Bacillus cytotoxicus TaxID=580165 RepID=A0ACC6A4T1_9BACI|nr:hypothetical protein [Bacillus cytotoxicus]
MSILRCPKEREDYIFYFPTYKLLLHKAKHDPHSLNPFGLKLCTWHKIGPDRYHARTGAPAHLKKFCCVFHFSTYKSPLSKTKHNPHSLPLFVLKLCAWQEKALTAPMHGQSLLTI